MAENTIILAIYTHRLQILRGFLLPSLLVVDKLT